MKKKIIFSIFLILFLIGYSTTSSYAQKKKDTKPTVPTKEISIDTVKIDYSKRKAPIVPFQDTLFFIYGNIGSITPQQRAKSIEENIKILEEDILFDADSLKIEIDGGIYLITYYGKTIIGITDPQAEVLKKTKAEIAKEYLEIIVHSIEKERAQGSWQNILKQVGLSLLILIITFFCLKYMNIGYKKLRIFIKKQKNRAIDKLTYILDADKQIAIALFLLKIIRIIVIIIILYLCLYAFFSLFPETKWLADTLIGYIISPLKSALVAVRNFIPDLFSIIVIFVLFKFLIKGIKVIADKISEGSMVVNGFYPDWAMPTFSIIKVILYIFMVILIFPHLPGSNSPAFQGISVFLGVLFSLGSTSVIANIVSGIVITYMRPFKLGDRIKMGEFLGNVIEKTPLVTRLKTPKNEIITIPNGTIMSAQTVKLYPFG
ncbi:MAG: mechanosensitive ion channel family protein [Dysgonomonas sp.]